MATPARFYLRLRRRPLSTPAAWGSNLRRRPLNPTTKPSRDHAASGTVGCLERQRTTPAGIRRNWEHSWTAAGSRWPDPAGAEPASNWGGDDSPPGRPAPPDNQNLEVPCLAGSKIRDPSLHPELAFSCLTRPARGAALAHLLMRCSQSGARARGRTAKDQQPSPDACTRIASLYALEPMNL